LIGVGLHLQLQLRRLFGLSDYQLFSISVVFEVPSAGAKHFFIWVFANPQFKLLQKEPAEITFNVISSQNLHSENSKGGGLLVKM
jgi:hypothetical protein